MDLVIVRQLSKRVQKTEISHFLMRRFWVPLGYHFGYHSVPKCTYKCGKFQKKSIVYNTKIRHNGTQNGTPVVPKMSNGTQMVSQLLDTLYKKINFHDFPSSKNGHITTLDTSPNFWVPSIIFLENIPCQLSEKKQVVVISQYLLTQLHFYDFLPNPGFSFVGQIAFFGYHRIFYGAQKFYHRKV